MSYELADNSPGAMPRVMFLGIEPAGYMLALMRALRKAWPGSIDTVFVARAVTQPWETDEAAFVFDVLPEGRLRPIRALRKRIDETRPHLLHVSGWGTPASIATIISGNARNLPVVVHHDTWCGVPSLWRDAIKSFVYPRFFRRVTHFAPYGRRQAAYLARFGVPSSRITTIDMTVDVTGIRHALASEPGARQTFRDRFGIPAESPLALFMGRLVPAKGIDDLLVAWPKVKAAAPTARLVIAGDGSLRPMVEAAAGADPDILPVGRLNGADVWRAYAAADYVVASSHREGWGLIVNEAMAAGVPAVVTNAYGCVGDLARDGETAFVVPPSSPGKLAQAMLKLASDPALRSRLSAAASKLISGWTIEAQAQKITGIWQRTLAAQSMRLVPGYEEA